MSRAAGRHNSPRKPEISEDKRAEYGLDDRDIPGGATHLVNPVTVHHKVPTPEKLDPFRGMMAHGVEPEDFGRYDRQHQGKPYHPHYAKPPEPVTPVPVYIVERSAGPRSLLLAATRNFQAPALTSEPVMICGEDGGRISVQILNEDSNHSARVGQLSDLAVDAANNIVGGSLLPKGMTSYLKMKTQRPLYILSADSGTPRISVIFETELSGAG